MIEYLIIKYSNGKITIMNNDKKKEIKEELVDYVLQIMNIFVAKINGLRKYKSYSDKKFEYLYIYKEISSFELLD